MTRPKTIAQRVDASDKRLKERGGRKFNLKLSPEAAQALEQLEASTGLSGTAIINELIIKAAKHENS